MKLWIRRTALGLALALTIMVLAVPGLADDDKHDKGHDKAPHWTYEGETGPEHWGDLSEDWKLAKTGKRQSPIDLSDRKLSEVASLETSYSASPLHIVNNGHTVKVAYGDGSSMTLGGEEFKLLQFHFHSPSEHTVEGRHYPLEVHLVHQSESGQLGVIGVFFEAGEENAALAGISPHAPKEAGDVQAIEGVSVNAAQLLPGDATRWTYSGSLTTPPCSENVRWTVMRTPLQASEAQLEAFATLYSRNARPVQPRNDRDLHLGR